MPFRLALAVLSIAAATAPPPDRPTQAGFERRVTADGTELGIWYPASGTPTRRRLGLHAQDVVAAARLPEGRHPLVVISHGTGGDMAGHVDTALALARAGFVVVAPTHPGDNWRDNGRATQVEARPRTLGAAISYMVQAWPGRAAIDADRIGAFGFSAGGFTVLAAAGGRPDMARLAGHCAEHPGFFDCTLLKAQPRMSAAPWPDARDARIRAIVVAAPALGFVFGEAGLAGVRVPVQLWRANDDRVLPAPFYADAVRHALPTRPAFHGVAGAGHFDFLAPCAEPDAAPQLCTSGPGFDRTAFHRGFNRAVVRFFSAHLAAPRREAATGRAPPAAAQAAVFSSTG